METSRDLKNIFSKVLGNQLPEVTRVQGINMTIGTVVSFVAGSKVSSVRSISTGQLINNAKVSKNISTLRIGDEVVVVSNDSRFAGRNYIVASFGGNVAHILENGGWVNWTPIFTNLNMALATLNVAQYTRIGDFISMFLKVSLTGAAISGSVSFTLPVEASTDVPNALPLGLVRLDDNAAASVTGRVDLTSSTVARILTYTAGGTYGGVAALSSIVPFTWANLDFISLSITYKAA